MSLKDTIPSIEIKNFYLVNPLGGSGETDKKLAVLEVEVEGRILYYVYAKIHSPNPPLVYYAGKDGKHYWVEDQLYRKRLKRAVDIEMEKLKNERQKRESG